MSRSYDRPKPPPGRGGGTGPVDPYDAFYDAYEEASVRAGSTQSAASPRDHRADWHDDQTYRTRPAGQAGQAASPQGYGGPRSPDDLTNPPRARPRPQPPAQAQPQALSSSQSSPREAYDSGLAVPPKPHAPPAQRDMIAPARAKRLEREQGHAPIVPAGSVTGRSLTLVISIMCFLACLTAGAVYMMNQSASAWLRDIASEVTVQIEPRQGADTDKTIRDVTQFLGRQSGIRNARALAVEESAGLLEPWLGSSEALKTLPVPRLISLELDRNAPPDFDALRANLTKQFKGVSLDDHRQWQQQIRTVTRSFALGGIAILLLVAAATTAIIISATRSAMASNRDIVEVLHFVGATDRFIAREFERNFMRLGIRSGLVGAVSAMAVFAVMPTVMELLGGGSVSLSEMRRLVGTGALDPMGYALLAFLVVVVAALCMFTSRLGVYRILHSSN